MEFDDWLEFQSFEIQLKEAEERRRYYDTAHRWEASLERLKMALSVKIEKAVLTRRELQTITNRWNEMEHDETRQWLEYVSGLVPVNDPRRTFKNYCHETPYKP